MPAVLVPLVLLAASPGVEFSLLGGWGASDYSIGSLCPQEVDFGRTAWAGQLEIRTEYLPEGHLGVGLAFGTHLEPYRWRAESDSISRCEEVREGYIALSASWRPVEGPVRPYARGAFGLHFGSLQHSCSHGDYTVSDGDGVATAVGMTLGGGTMLHLAGPAWLLAELGYTIVPRDSFQGWQVAWASSMNSWRFLLGAGMSL